MTKVSDQNGSDIWEMAQVSGRDGSGIWEMAQVSGRWLRYVGDGSVSVSI